MSFLSMTKRPGCLSILRNTWLSEKKGGSVFKEHRDKGGGRKIATMESPEFSDPSSQGSACGQQASGCKASVVQTQKSWSKNL